MFTSRCACLLSAEDPARRFHFGNLRGQEAALLQGEGRVTGGGWGRAPKAQFLSSEFRSLLILLLSQLLKAIVAFILTGIYMSNIYKQHNNSYFAIVIDHELSSMHLVTTLHAERCVPFCISKWFLKNAEIGLNITSSSHRDTM